MTQSETLKVIIAVSIALCASCTKDRSTGGGTPTRCGTGTAGSTCQNNDDCTCSLSCLDSVCLTVVDPEALRSDEPPPTPTSTMIRVCRKVGSLPCAERDYDADLCARQLAGFAEAFAESGCGPQFNRYVTCIDTQPLHCDAQGEEVVFPEACRTIANEIELQCELCLNSIRCSSRTSTSGPDKASPCTVKVREECDAEREGEMSCYPSMEGGNQVWICSCTKGTSSRVMGFDDDAVDCCAFGDLVKDVCGLIAE